MLLTPQLKDFLQEKEVEFASHQGDVIVKPTEEVMDFLLERYAPRPTPVTAVYYSRDK